VNRSGPSHPPVSVIVPVWNDPAGLASCLSALRSQDYPANQLEIVIVDNDSHPPLLLRDSPGMRVLRERAPGSYRARNRGIEAAGGEVFAFTDSDCVPSMDWVSAGVRRLLALSNPGLVAGAVEVVPTDRSHPTLVELYEMVLAFPQQAYVSRGHFGATCNLFTCRDVVAAVGPFRADLTSGGDAEWGWRVHSAGRMLAFAGDAVVFHPARRTMAALIRKARRVAGGMVQIHQRRPVRLAIEQAKELMPPPFFVRMILETALAHGVVQRFQLLGLLVLVRQVRFWERVRVWAGGEPVR